MNPFKEFVRRVLRLLEFLKRNAAGTALHPYSTIMAPVTFEHSHEQRAEWRRRMHKPRYDLSCARAIRRITSTAATVFPAAPCWPRHDEIADRAALHFLPHGGTTARASGAMASFR